MMHIGENGLTISGQCHGISPINFGYTGFRLEGDSGYTHIPSELIVELFLMLHFEYNRNTPCTLEEFAQVYIDRHKRERERKLASK
jgi:hypothetical protein